MIVATMHSAPTRRQVLLSSAAIAASSSRPVVAASSATAVPTYPLADGLNISRVIKGCWQLSGGHHGDRTTDRTSGKAAVEDFQQFVDVGITTFDTADIYGPSQQLIGEFLASSPSRSKCQVLTKFCCFGQATREATKASFVAQSIDSSRANLGVSALDCVQVGFLSYIYIHIYILRLNVSDRYML
jgi:diketogulonate reductase-like aldo/keto reductase